jgi:hypothetical protein
LRKLGAEPAGGSPEDMQAYVLAETEKWGKAGPVFPHFASLMAGYERFTRTSCRGTSSHPPSSALT